MFVCGCCAPRRGGGGGLPRTRRADADLHRSLRLARPDDERNTRCPRYRVAAGIRQPVIAQDPAARGRHSRCRSTPWNTKVTRRFAKAAPADGKTAAPRLGHNEVESCPATNEQPILCEQLFVRGGVSSSTRLQSTAGRESDAVQNDGRS